MRISVDNQIVVTDPINEIIEYCKNDLILDNPEYYKKLSLGKWVGNISDKIYLYSRDGKSLILPFGCLNAVWKIHPHKEDWDVNIHELKKIEYRSSIKPYDYQEEAIKTALSKKNGVLVMPCGSGKTQCGIEIVCRIGGKALWLTHTQDLLNQSLTRAKSVLDMPVGSFGTITAGKVNIGTHITFATVQTMCKLDLQKYKDTFDIVIIDEAQHCAGTPTRVTQFYKVVTSLSSRYKYGLTATPKRADGLEKAMFAILGNIVHEVSKKQVEANTCPIKVQKIATGYVPDYNAILMGDGTVDYSKLIDDMIHDEDRFKFVLHFVNGCIGGCLVLANRVEYLQRLNDQYIAKSVCISGAGQSKKAKEERKEALRKLNDGEIQCVFATYQLAKEGLDVPNLRYVVFATPEKDETTVIQSAGRVGRKADEKEWGNVIDFVDDFGMYQGWSKKRNLFYKKIGAIVELY